MDTFAFIVIGLCFVVIAISIDSIINPNSEYNKRKKNVSSENDESNNQSHKFDQEEFNKKVMEAQQKASDNLIKHLQDIEMARKEREKIEEKYKDNNPVHVYKGRKPSIDSFGLAQEGIGVEFKVVGMKYRPVEDQLVAHSLEQGDTVLLIPEINDFSGTEAMAVYTPSKYHIGYIVTEQCKRAKDMMFREYLQAFVKIPWDSEKSWFLVVVPRQDL